MSYELDSIQHTDLFDLCAQLDAASIDMILADLPYGTTACSWDTVIPFEPLWAAFKRVIKPRGAIVLTASQPFTSALVMSNVGMFRYEWVWDKKLSNGFLNSQIMPLKRHENTLVFGLSMPRYYPQMQPRPERRVNKASGNSWGKDSTSPYGFRVSVEGDYSELFPTSIIDCSNANQAEKLHPTQKPVALFEYLIRTYTREGETVLDPCVGSGTTAVAARACKRHYVCGDSSAEYVAIARDRLRMPFEPRLTPQNDDVSDLPLFAQGN